MLQSGGRARDLRVGHGQPRRHQPFGDGLHGVGVAAHQPRRGGHDLFQRHAHHVRHFFAVVLADDDVGDAPFADGAVLGRHVAQPRPEHALRGLREDLGIQQDEGGRGVVQRQFDVVDLHGGGIGGKAVHGGRGADDAALAPRGMGEHLAQVVDHARADAEDEVAGGVEVHHHRAELPFRGGDAVVPAGDDVGLEGHARFGEHFLHARTRGAIGVVVADHEGMLGAHGFERLGKRRQRPAFDAQPGQIDGVALAAGAVIAAGPGQFGKAHRGKFRHGHSLP